MKALVLGNPSSRWIKEFVEYIMLPSGYRVTLVTTQKSCVFDEFYKQNAVEVWKYESAGKLLGKVPFFRVLDSAYRTAKRKKNEEFDVIINLFVNHKDLALTQKLKGKKTQTIVCYCGSDLLRKNSLEIFINKLLLRNPDSFVLGSKTLEKPFREYYGKSIKPTIIRFGISVFDSIDKIFADRVLDNKRKTVLCIGYNGSPAQQHLEVLSAIERLPDEMKTQIFLEIPMTYKYEEDYKKCVEKKAGDIGVDFDIKTAYMDNTEMAKLWCSTDIFINAQTTDSLSASVLESLYAECTLINAAWLQYPEYNDFGITYQSFDSFDNLDTVIKDCLLNADNSRNNENRKHLYENMSWEFSRNNWRKLLNQ